MKRRNQLLLLLQAGQIAETLLSDAASAANLGNVTQLLICLQLLDAAAHPTRGATVSELAIRMRTSEDRVRKQAHALLASGDIERFSIDDQRCEGRDLRGRPYVLTQQGARAAARGLHAAKETDEVFAALMPIHLVAGLRTFDAWIEDPFRRSLLHTPASLKRALCSGGLVSKRRGHYPTEWLRR